MNTPKHNHLRTSGHIPPLAGADAPHLASDARGEGHPFACERDLRDALTDLVNESGTSIARPLDPKCPMCFCLAKHGLVRWTQHVGPGKWVVTQKGLLFVETRNLSSWEAR